MNTVNLAGVNRQRGQHHGDLSQALVTAALDLLADGSTPAELSLRAVARRAGVSPAAPYHHFASKHALLERVALEGFRRLRDVQDRQRVGEDPYAAIARLTQSYIEFARSHRAHYAVMITTLGSSQGRTAEFADPELAAVAIATFDHLVAAVARTGAQESTARGRALQIWALAHGATTLADVAIALDPAFTPQQVLRHTSDIASLIAGSG